MTSNVFAPPAMAGLNDANPPGFVDVDFTYTFDADMPAGASWRDQQVPIENDADFVWRGVCYTDIIAGAFNVRFQDSQGYYLSSGMVSNGNISNEPSSPTPVFPGLIFPAGSRIGIDIDNVAGIPIHVQFAFRGVKRYRVAR